MNSIVYYVKGKPMPDSAPNWDDTFPDYLEETNPKVRKRVLVYNDDHVMEDSFYVNHEMFSDLGPRTDADKVIGNKLIIDNL